MLFKILKGPSSRISTDITPFHEGYAYVTEDGGDFYVDLIVEGKQKRVQINPDEIPAGGKDGQLLTKTATGWEWKDAPTGGSESFPAVLYANRWEAGKQVISLRNVKADTNGVVGISQDISESAMEAAQAASLYISGQTTGSITITAFGDTPAVDIPISVVLIN